MSFMELQIGPKEHGYRVETLDGTYYYPGDIFTKEEIRKEFGGKVESIESVFGYFGRYSAPGYLDCTDWSFDTNKRRLAKKLRDLYGD